MTGEIIESLLVNGKPVYIFESHNFAIIPWAEMSVKESVAPYLISLDYHTDTRSAFLNHACWKSQEDADKTRSLQQSLCAEINKNDPASTLKAALLLKHDEHIDAAIRSNIITHSFSVQYSDSSGTLSNERRAYIDSRSNIVELILGRVPKVPEPLPPFTYQIPENRMFIVPNLCAIGCTRGPHTDECTLDHANQALEDIFLQNQLDYISQMSTTSGLGNPNSQPYILDIDLDYFMTLRSANPETTSVFYTLIRGAIGITIARESQCVEMFRLEGETITGNQLQEIVINHIRTATSTK